MNNDVQAIETADYTSSSELIFQFVLIEGLSVSKVPVDQPTLLDIQTKIHYRPSHTDGEHYLRYISPLWLVWNILPYKANAKNHNAPCCTHPESTHQNVILTKRNANRRKHLRITVHVTIFIYYAKN